MNMTQAVNTPTVVQSNQSGAPLSGTVIAGIVSGVILGGCRYTAWTSHREAIAVQTWTTARKDKRWQDQTTPNRVLVPATLMISAPGKISTRSTPVDVAQAMELDPELAGFSPYFVEHSVDGSVLLALDNAMLQDMGIENADDQTRILAWVEKVRESPSDVEV